MIGIDLFAGAGGMTLGAIQAGIDVKFAVELDKAAALTYSHNNKGVFLFNDDIRKLKKIPIKRGKDQLVVFGGPPCQGFSTSNQRTRSIRNPNNWLFSEFLRIVKSFQPLPEWVVFENVQGFTGTEDGIFLKKILASFEALGYTISHNVLNAAEFGVPQRRARFFAIASLKGHSIRFPAPITEKPIPVKKAFVGLPSLSVGANESFQKYVPGNHSIYAKTMRGNLRGCFNHIVSRNSKCVISRYKHIPQGGNWENIPAKLMRNYKDRSRCHTGIYYRLKEDRPSIVIGNYRKNMLVHPTENRGLSVREAARLQSFPDWYEFKGSIGFQQQQVGNAVPPMLAKVVFETIFRC